MARSVALALGIAMVLLATTQICAQSLLPVSFEATLGMGKGWTRGEYLGNRSGLAVDVLLGVRLRQIGSGALVAGLSASAQAAGTNTTVCRPAVGGGCVPGFPDFFAVGPLAGWESGHGVFRALLGPALMQARGDGRAAGVQGRIDLAVPVVGRLGAVASIRPTLIPDYHGDSITLLAFGLGLRFR